MKKVACSFIVCLLILLTSCKANNEAVKTQEKTDSIPKTTNLAVGNSDYEIVGLKEMACKTIQADTSNLPSSVGQVKLCVPDNWEEVSTQDETILFKFECDGKEAGTLEWQNYYIKNDMPEPVYQIIGNHAQATSIQKKIKNLPYESYLLSVDESFGAASNNTQVMKKTYVAFFVYNEKEDLGYAYILKFNNAVADTDTVNFIANSVEIK